MGFVGNGGWVRRLRSGWRLRLGFEMKTQVLGVKAAEPFRIIGGLVWSPDGDSRDEFGGLSMSSAEILDNEGQP